MSNNIKKALAILTLASICAAGFALSNRGSSSTAYQQGAFIMKTTAPTSPAV